VRHGQLHLLGYSTDAAAAAAIVYFNIAATPQPGRLLPVHNTHPGARKD